jgi:antitoxin component YwqK of YwqJK toxin-antitoxin module
MFCCVILIAFTSCGNKGEVTISDEAGNIVEKYYVLPDSTKNGTYMAYYSDGNLKESALYVNGNLDGERLLYLPSGVLEISENYADGQMNGDYTVYHENGKPNLILNYIAGQVQGTGKKYFENGQLEELVQFVDNEENGPFQEFYENGQVHWEGQYLNGDNEFGELKEYDEQGQLIKKMLCDSSAVCRTIWTIMEGDIVPKN